MWTTQVPQEPGFYWWRENNPDFTQIHPNPIIRELKRDGQGIYCEGWKLKVEVLGGEWYPVALTPPE